MFIWEILLIISLAGMILILVRRLPQAVNQVRNETPPLTSVAVERPRQKDKVATTLASLPGVDLLVAAPDPRAAPSLSPADLSPRPGETATVESAEAAYKTGDFARAALLYEELVRDQADDLKLRNRLGLTYLELERFHEARDQFRVAVKEGTDVASHHANLAMAEYGLGHHLTAIRHLKRAIALNPETKKYQNLLSTIEEERG